VTNTNATTGTLNNGYTYRPQQFDPNGDNVVDSADIFYLVNYLYLSGHVPIGSAGMPMNGDANQDGVIDPADIFYTVNYLFNNGPRPWAVAGRPAADSVRGSLDGAISLGEPVLRNGRWVVPVIVTMADGSATPQTMSLTLRFDGASNAVVRRAGAASTLQPLFEISRHTNDSVVYLVSFDARTPLVMGGSAVVAELELAPRTAGRIDIDPALTLLGNAGGTESATSGNGRLQLHGLDLEGQPPRTPKQSSKGTNAE
jgi:hypothetical protein